MLYGVYINDCYYGFHEKKKVAVSYAKKYAKSNPLETKIRIDRLNPERYSDNRFLDYWLEPINKTYVPSIYYDVMDEITYTTVEKRKNLERKLKELLLLSSLKKKDLKAIVDVLAILKKKRKSCEKYTPSIRILSDAYWRMCEYRSSYLE